MIAQLQRYASSPATQLEAVFRDIERTRMAGLNIARAASNGNPRSRILVSFLAGLQVKFINA